MFVKNWPAVVTLRRRHKISRSVAKLFSLPEVGNGLSFVSLNIHCIENEANGSPMRCTFCFIKMFCTMGYYW
jgi:hypothetical protein